MRPDGQERAMASEILGGIMRCEMLDTAVDAKRQRVSERGTEITRDVREASESHMICSKELLRREAPVRRP